MRGSLLFTLPLALVAVAAPTAKHHTHFSRSERIPKNEWLPVRSSTVFIHDKTWTGHLDQCWELCDPKGPCEHSKSAAKICVNFKGRDMILTFPSDTHNIKRYEIEVQYLGENSFFNHFKYAPAHPILEPDFCEYDDSADRLTFCTIGLAGHKVCDGKSNIQMFKIKAKVKATEVATNRDLVLWAREHPTIGNGDWAYFEYLCKP